MSTPVRAVLIPGLVVLGLVIAAIVVVLLVASDSPSEFDPDSPEATIQEFQLLLRDGDTAAAYELLSEDTRSDFTLREFRDINRWSMPNDQRIEIDRVEIDNDEARVLLTIHTLSGSGLDFNRYSYTRDVRLVREDNRWNIDEPLASFSMLNVTRMETA